MYHQPLPSGLKPEIETLRILRFTWLIIHSIILRSKKGTIQYNPERIFAIKDVCKGGLGFYVEPHQLSFNRYDHIGGSDINPYYAIFSSNDSQRFRELQIEAFYKTFEEIYGRSFVKNEIPGLEIEESNQLEYELEISRTPKEVKPDGESTVEITVTL